MRIIYSPRFASEYRKLPQEVRIKAEAQEQIFRANPFDVRLRTHKLQGRLSDLWAWSVDYRYRIVFEFIEGDRVVFHLIGDHSIYKRLL